MTQLTSLGGQRDEGLGTGVKAAGAETTEEAKLMHNEAAGEVAGAREMRDPWKMPAKFKK